MDKLELANVFKDYDVDRVETLDGRLGLGQLFPKLLAYKLRPGNG